MRSCTETDGKNIQKKPNDGDTTVRTPELPWLLARSSLLPLAPGGDKDAEDETAGVADAVANTSIEPEPPPTGCEPAPFCSA
jgi:hypothetical protein